jgi:hypothetical protein
MFNPHLYDPALSKEITSYIEPYIHFLLILRESFVDEKQDKVYNYISDIIEQQPNEVDQYKLFIVVCCYSTDVNTILSVIDNLNLDMNHPYLNNFDAYPITFEGLQSAISRGRDLQRFRECRNVLELPYDLENCLHADFLGSGVTFNSSSIHINTSLFEQNQEIYWYTPLQLYLSLRDFNYDIARLYLDNGSDPFTTESMFDSPLMLCVDDYMNVNYGSRYLKNPSMLLFISHMIDMIPPENIHTLYDQVVSKDSDYLTNAKQLVYDMFIYKIKTL